jgi:hypothetical protein
MFKNMANFLSNLLSRDIFAYTQGIYSILSLLVFLNTNLSENTELQ